MSHNIDSSQILNTENSVHVRFFKLWCVADFCLHLNISSFETRWFFIFPAAICVVWFFPILLFPFSQAAESVCIQTIF